MDRRAYLKTVGAVGVTGVVAGCLGSDPETIIPGTNSGFPPFEYTEDGELVGFDIDLSEAVIEEAGFEVGEWQDIAFDSLIPSVNSEDIDLIAAAMTITEDRDEDIDFSNPYYESNQAVLVNADMDPMPTSTDDLEGLIVGAQSGTTGQGEIDGLVDDGIISSDDTRQYDNYTLAVTDLENGNVDVIIIDIPVARNFENTRDVVVAFDIETGEEFGFGMRENDDRLEDINDALAAVQDDGTYDELVGEYFE